MAERDGRDLAAVLLRKARGDETTVGALLEEEVPDEVVGFHAQQAVEKSLKAVLALNQIDYAFSHDLSYLGDLLESNGVEVPPGVREGEELRPWRLDRKRASALAAVATEWAADALGQGH